MGIIWSISSSMADGGYGIDICSETKKDSGKWNEYICNRDRLAISWSCNVFLTCRCGAQRNTGQVKKMVRCSITPNSLLLWTSQDLGITPYLFLSYQSQIYDINLVFRVQRISTRVHFSVTSPTVLP